MPILDQLKRCSRCVLPETFPGIGFDGQGLCTFCQKAPPSDEVDRQRARLRTRMEQTLNSHRRMLGYECVVAFSGGKDSSYTLAMLVREYKLNCLAVTIDNGFLSEQARRNCQVVTQALGVDHLFFTPAPEFMTRMYRKSVTETDLQPRSAIRRASRMCNSCISLINNYMIRTALQQQVSLIAGGYIGGQVPKYSAVLEIDVARRAVQSKRAMEGYVRHFGNRANDLFGLEPEFIDAFAGRKLYVINPMLTRAVTVEKIIDSIEELGWRMTSDTGQNSSNCLLNELGIAVHYKQHRFNPYVFELSEQVRLGLMEREQALAKALAVPEADEVAAQAKKLNLALDQIEPVSW